VVEKGGGGGNLLDRWNSVIKSWSPDFSREERCGNAERGKLAGMLTAGVTPRGSIEK